MTTHIVTSHGADFFGQDHYPARELRELAQHVRGVLPHDDHPPLTQILNDAGEREHAFSTDEATLLAVLLRRACTHRALAQKHARVTALLGQAAARAAGDGEPWTWTPKEEA